MYTWKASHEKESKLQKTFHPRQHQRNKHSNIWSCLFLEWEKICIPGNNRKIRCVNSPSVQIVNWFFMSTAFRKTRSHITVFSNTGRGPGTSNYSLRAVRFFHSSSETCGKTYLHKQRVYKVCPQRRCGSPFPPQPSIVSIACFTIVKLLILICFLSFFHRERKQRKVNKPEEER